jgi:hypothetical protein
MAGRPYIELQKVVNVNISTGADMPEKEYYQLSFGDKYYQSDIYIDDLDNILSLYKTATPMEFLRYLYDAGSFGEYSEFFEYIKNEAKGVNFFNTWVDL